MKNLLPVCLAFLFTLTLYVVLRANPEPPQAGTPPRCCTLGDKLPDLNGDSNWGRVTQTGRTLSIQGHPIWDVLGTIRADGSVLVIWTLSATGAPCPGVYHVEKDGTMVGQWGYGHLCTVGEDGKLTGVTQYCAHGQHRTGHLSHDATPANIVAAVRGEAASV